MPENQNSKPDNLEGRTFQLAITVQTFVELLPKTIANIDGGKHEHKRHCKIRGLTDVNVHQYVGGKDGGLAHVTYWGLPDADPDYYDVLSSKEQAKAGKINANVLHAAAFQPTNADIPGTEVTGLLRRSRRVQSITFRLPGDWNGKLVVAGTPGLRNEYANEAVLVPWLLEAGYAYIAGNKGIPGGANDMISGKHPTQYWGDMMIDLALLGQDCLKKFARKKIARIYAMGLSNGGYQARRALEIDHERMLRGRKPLFDGGVDWSGAYWPDKRVMDADGDGRVSVYEYAAADTLVGSIDKGTLAMGWFHSPDTLSTQPDFKKTRAFPVLISPWSTPVFLLNQQFIGAITIPISMVFKSFRASRFSVASGTTTWFPTRTARTFAVTIQSHQQPIHVIPIPPIPIHPHRFTTGCNTLTMVAGIGKASDTR